MGNMRFPRLRDAALFKGLSPDEVNLVLSQAAASEYSPRSFVFRQGDPEKRSSCSYRVGCGFTKLCLTVANC